MAKRLNFQKVIFIILLFAFVLGEIARIQFPNGVAIKALDIAVFLFVVLLVLHSWQKLARPRLARPIMAFIGAAVLSLFFNFLNLKTNELLVSSLYLIKWIAYVGVYFIIANFDINLKKKIPNILVAIGGIILSLGFIQYFFYPDLRNLYYLGWDEHLYRLFSTFLDPNFAGAFFVLYFLFVLDYFFKKRSKLLVVLLAASIGAIILTFSRSAYLMLFVGLFTFLFMKGQKKLIAGFILVFVIVVSILASIDTKSEGTNLLRTASSEARITSAQNALVIFEKNPILGVGFNAYKFASERYGFSKTSKYSDHSAAGTDNSFLFVLATTGIIGFAAYSYLWFKIISISKNMRSILLFSSAVALLFNALFINSLFYSFIMLWMWILLGLLEN